MATSPIPTFFARLLSLVALGLLTVAVIVGVTSGPGFQPLRDRAIRMLGGIPAGAAEVGKRRKAPVKIASANGSMNSP